MNWCSESSSFQMQFRQILIGIYHFREDDGLTWKYYIAQWGDLIECQTYTKQKCCCLQYLGDFGMRVFSLTCQWYVKWSLESLNAGCVNHRFESWIPNYVFHSQWAPGGEMFSFGGVQKMDPLGQCSLGKLPFFIWSLVLNVINVGKINKECQ